MDNHKTFNFDEDLKIWGEMNQLIDKGASRRSAALAVCEKFGVSHDTMLSKFKRMENNGGRAHGLAIFTLEQEETLVGVAQGFSMLSRDLPPSLFKDMIKLFRIRIEGAHKETNEWDPSDWLRGFLERQKNKLSPNMVARLLHERVGPKVLDDTQMFVEWFPLFMKGKEVPAKTLLNSDETRIRIEGDLHKKCITHADKEIKSSLGGVKGKAATYIPFFNAVGNMLISVYILPLDKDGCADVPLRKVSHALRGSHPVYYGFSETGWSNQFLWRSCIEVLAAELALQYPGLHAVLLLDHLNAHISPESIELCIHNKIWPAYFPVHATHFIQPADDLVIATFKKALYEGIAVKLVSVRRDHRDLGSLLVTCAVEIENRISPKVIQASRERVGLFPFDSKKIILHAQKNVGIIENDSGTIHHDVRIAVMDVINDILTPIPSKNSISMVKVHPPANQLFSGEEILSLHKEKVREDEEKKRERENMKRKREDEKREAAEVRDKKKVDHECRGTQHEGSRKPVWKSSSDWIWCDHCDDFGLCPKCKVPDMLVMTMHEGGCSGSP